MQQNHIINDKIRLLPSNANLFSNQPFYLHDIKAGCHKFTEFPILKVIPTFLE